MTTSEINVEKDRKKSAESKILGEKLFKVSDKYLLDHIPDLKKKLKLAWYYWEGQRFEN